jgi:hypothetical protein
VSLVTQDGLRGDVPHSVDRLRSRLHAWRARLRRARHHDTKVGALLSRNTYCCSQLEIIYLNYFILEIHVC